MKRVLPERTTQVETVSQPVRVAVKPVLSPYVPPARAVSAETASLPILPRLAGLEGRLIAFWNDSAAEGDVVQPVVERFLRARGAEVVSVRQPGPSFPPLEDNIAAAARAEAAILGVAA